MLVNLANVKILTTGCNYPMCSFTVKIRKNVFPVLKFPAIEEQVSLERLQEAPKIDVSSVHQNNSKSKLIVPKQSATDHFRVAAFGGEFQQLGAEISSWQTSKNRTLYGKTGYTSQDGQFENNAIRHFQVNGQMSQYIGENFLGRASVDFQNKKYGFHGKNIRRINPGYDRRHHYFQTELSGRHTLSPATDFIFYGNIGAGKLKDRSEALNLTADWRTFSLHTKLSHRFEKLKTQFNLTLIDDQIDPSTSTKRGGTQLSKFSGEALIPIRRNMNLTFGFILTSANPKNGAREKRISPLLKAVWVPQQQTAFSVELNGGWHHTPVYQRLQQNPYINLTSSFDAEDKKLQLNLNMEHRISDDMVLKVGYLRHDMRQLVYWQDSVATSGLFSLQTLPDVTLSDFSITLEVIPTSHLKLISTLHLLG